MSDALRKVSAVVRADFMIRFRRTSTLAAFVLMCLTAYLLVPDPATGSTLMAWHDRRALYNSEAVAAATACLYSMLLSLLGFYLVSNAVGRDIRTRTGAVIASTTVTNWQYLTGKFVGNVVSLLTLCAGLVLSAMIMHLLRGEASLQPGLYLEYYALLVVPAVMTTSVLAIAFESTPMLSGKLGDALYFFLWTGLVGFLAWVAVKSPGRTLLGLPLAFYLDPSGLAVVVRQATQTLGSGSFSIGATPYDMSKAPFVFQGLRFGWPEIASRITSAFLPLILLVWPWSRFHRFDPGVLRGGAAQRSGGHWAQALNRRVKFVVRLADRLVYREKPSRKSSFLRSTLADVWLTVSLNPLGMLGGLGLGLACLGVSAQWLGRLILPLQFPFIALLICDCACREARAGTTALVFTAPRLRSMFVLWKMFGSLALVYGLTLAPMTRLAIEGRFQTVFSLLLGGAFVAACATSLGVIGSNPKPFLACSLLFWYLAFTDAGRNPALDFAGWHGQAGWSIQVVYASLGLLLLAVAQASHRFRLRN